MCDGKHVDPVSVLTSSTPCVGLQGLYQQHDGLSTHRHTLRLSVLYLGSWLPHCTVFGVISDYMAWAEENR